MFLLLLVQHRLELEHMLNDQFLHLFLDPVNFGYGRANGFAVGMVRRHQVEKRSPEPINLSPLLIKGFVEQRRFLLEQVSLLRLERERFKKVGLDRGRFHRNPSRKTITRSG